MFTGSFLHTIDDKGRMSIPGRYREFLASNGLPAMLMMTKLLDPCLTVYPVLEWKAIYDRFREAAKQDDSAPEEMDDFSRRFFSSAEECPIDRQGRILIPQSLRDVGQLNGEARILGGGHKFEIWKPSLWEEKSRRDIRNTREIRSRQMRLGM